MWAYEKKGGGSGQLQDGGGLEGVGRRRLEIGAKDDPAEREAEAFSSWLPRPKLDPISEGRHDAQNYEWFVANALASHGEPLDQPVKQLLERRSGKSLNDVVVHSGPAARESAKTIGSHAYCIGKHILIGDSVRNNIHSAHIIAHEVSHSKISDGKLYKFTNSNQPETAESTEPPDSMMSVAPPSATTSEPTDAPQFATLGKEDEGDELSIDMGYKFVGASVEMEDGKVKSVTIKVTGGAKIAAPLSPIFAIVGEISAEAGGTYEPRDSEKDIWKHFKLSAEVGLAGRLLLGTAAAMGEELPSYEIGAGAEIAGSGSVEIMADNEDEEASIDASVSGVGVAAFNAGDESGVEFDFKVAFPLVEYDKLYVVKIKVGPGGVSFPSHGPGPGWEKLKRDVAAVRERYVRWVTGEPSERDAIAYRDDLNSAHTDFLTLWRVRRESLEAAGVPIDVRNLIFEKYLEYFRYMYPESIDVAVNVEAAEAALAEADRLEFDAAQSSFGPAPSPKASAKPLPPAIRGEVKTRVENFQESGSIPYGGTNYDFRYDRGLKTINVRSARDEKYTVKYTPKWLSK